MLRGIGAGRGSSSHLPCADDAPARAVPDGLDSLAAGPWRSGELAHPLIDRNSHPEREPQAPAGRVSGAMDALGRVTEGQAPRPDPSLAPAYLALTPLRGWQSGYAGSAHHAYPQGAQGMPPERPHHRGSRREGARPPNQPRSGIGGQPPQALRRLGPRSSAGTGPATWHVKRKAQGPALRVRPTPAKS